MRAREAFRAPAVPTLTRLCARVSLGQGYAYSLYRALVPDSCDTAVLEFSQLSTGGAGGGAIPPPGSPEAGLPWQRPR